MVPSPTHSITTCRGPRSPPLHGTGQAGPHNPESLFKQPWTLLKGASLCACLPSRNCHRPTQHLSQTHTAPALPILLGVTMRIPESSLSTTYSLVLLVSTCSPRPTCISTDFRSLPVLNSYREGSQAGPAPVFCVSSSVVTMSPTVRHPEF